MSFDWIAEAALDPSDAKVTTKFNGDRLFEYDRVDISVGGVALNSNEHSVKEPLRRFSLPDSPVSGHTLRDWTLLDYSPEGTSTAHVTVSRGDEHPTDYLAGGYWIRLDGNLSNGMIDASEVGAFVDGPELSDTATIPQTGTVTYSGRSSGLYTFLYGPAWLGIAQGAPEGEKIPPPGTKESGVFTGDVLLIVDFDSKIISGGIGCVAQLQEIHPPGKVLLETAGDIVTPGGTRDVLYAVYRNYPPPLQPDPDRNSPCFTGIKFEGVPIADDGTFSGDDLVVEILYFDSPQSRSSGIPESTSSGSLEGRFSLKTDDSGISPPRVVAGTIHARWGNSLGGSLRFVGSFFAGNPQ